MVNVKEENKRQSNNIKEWKNRFLDNQRQQLENTTSTFSETTNKINNNINQYQETNRAILDKNIDRANRHQQETINTIQSISNNYVELQRIWLILFNHYFQDF